MERLGLGLGLGMTLRAIWIRFEREEAMVMSHVYVLQGGVSVHAFIQLITWRRNEEHIHTPKKSETFPPHFVVPREPHLFVVCMHVRTYICMYVCIMYVWERKISYKIRPKIKPIHGMEKSRNRQPLKTPNRLRFCLGLSFRAQTVNPKPVTWLVKA